jgi:hypothetical protein
MLDTCVLLDISTKKKNLPVVSALEVLTESGLIDLICPDLVVNEFNKNKSNVAKRTRKRLSDEFKQVKNIVREFGGEKKEDAVNVLNDVSTRLPLLSEVNGATFNRVEKLIDISSRLQASDNVKIAVTQRGIDKKAPLHLDNKNSIADAVIIEQFSEFVLDHQSEDNTFFFVTHNHTDFSSQDHRKPHNDFHDIFKQSNVHFFNNTPSAIEIIDDKILADIKFEHEYTEEIRGLGEILSAMDELFDKIWYNRHCNLLCGIESGDITIVPDDTQKHGDDIIHENIWKGALKSAQEVKEKYDNTGPWDDFEWGMLNGKLSALRWVLGDEWDMLDT